MTMIEKIARALSRAGSEIFSPEVREAHVEKEWPYFVKDARAALEAMREPTDYMHRHVGNRGVQSYREMIDEALSEGEP